MKSLGDPRDLESLVRRQASVVTRRQALGYLPEAAIRQALASRRWQAVHRGIYAVHNGPLAANQRVWAAVLFGGRHGEYAPLAGLSALAAAGLRGFTDSVVHIHVPIGQKSTKPPEFVRAHRTRSLPVTDLRRGRPPRARNGRAVLDAASWAATDDRARALVAAAFQQRLVTFEEIMTSASGMTRLPRRNLIMATIRDAAGGSHSVPELDFLNLCRTGGLPEPDRQAVMVDPGGRRWYRDAFFEEWNLHVEIDGGQHMDVQNWWADMQRQNAMWTAGARILRFPAWAIRNRPGRVIEQVRAALLAAGWRP